MATYSLTNARKSQRKSGCLPKRSLMGHLRSLWILSGTLAPLRIYQAVMEAKERSMTEEEISQQTERGFIKGPPRQRPRRLYLRRAVAAQVPELHA